MTIITNIKSSIRINLERQLLPTLDKYSKGDTLEIGPGNISYKKHINYNSYKTLDIKGKNHIDYIEDIHNTSIESNSFDTIIMIEVLEHLYNPFQAINEVRRILKPGGCIIASTPFIHPYHGEPHDYYRYTKFGLIHLFNKFKIIEIIEYGNVFGSIIDLLTSYRLFKVLKIFNHLRINKTLEKYFKNKTPLGILIVAKKQENE